MAFSLFDTTYSEEIYNFKPPLAIILDKPWAQQSEESREALTKLLGAVHLSPESVRMIHQPTLDLSAWMDPPARILAFIIPPKGIAVNEKITTPTSEMVVTEPLSVLLADEEKKRKFWAAVRELFGV